MTRTLLAILLVGGGIWYLVQFGLFYPKESSTPGPFDADAQGQRSYEAVPNTLEEARRHYLEELPPDVPDRYRFTLLRSSDLGLTLEKARLRRAQDPEPEDVIRITSPVGEVDRDALTVGFEGQLPLEIAGRAGALRVEVFAEARPEVPVLTFRLTGNRGEPFPPERDRLSYGERYAIVLRWEGGRSARQWFQIATPEERAHLETALKILRRTKADRYGTLLEINLYRALGRTSDAYHLVEATAARFPTDPQRRAFDDVLRAELDLPPRILKLDRGR